MLVERNSHGATRVTISRDIHPRPYHLKRIKRAENDNGSGARDATASARELHHSMADRIFSSPLLEQA
jgi:hypothetical protein